MEENKWEITNQNTKYDSKKAKQNGRINLVYERIINIAYYHVLCNYHILCIFSLTWIDRLQLTRTDGFRLRVNIFFLSLSPLPHLVKCWSAVDRYLHFKRLLLVQWKNVIWRRKRRAKDIIIWHNIMSSNMKDKRGNKVLQSAGDQYLGNIRCQILFWFNEI